MITGLAEKLQWRKSGVAMLLNQQKSTPARPEKAPEIMKATSRISFILPPANLRRFLFSLSPLSSNPNGEFISLQRNKAGLMVLCPYKHLAYGKFNGQAFQSLIS